MAWYGWFAFVLTGMLAFRSFVRASQCRSAGSFAWGLLWVSVSALIWFANPWILILVATLLLLVMVVEHVTSDPHIDPIIRDVQFASRRELPARISAAARDLEALGPGTAPALRRYLYDWDVFVRRLAITVLGQLRDPRAIRPLEEQLRRPDDGNHPWVTTALQRLGSSATPSNLAPKLDLKLRRFRSEAEEDREIQSEAIASLLYYCDFASFRRRWQEYTTEEKRTVLGLIPLIRAEMRLPPLSQVIALAVSEGGDIARHARTEFQSFASIREFQERTGEAPEVIDDPSAVAEARERPDVQPLPSLEPPTLFATILAAHPYRALPVVAGEDDDAFERAMTRHRRLMEAKERLADHAAGDAYLRDVRNAATPLSRERMVAALLLAERGDPDAAHELTAIVNGAEAERDALLGALLPHFDLLANAPELEDAIALRLEDFEPPLRLSMLQRLWSNKKRKLLGPEVETQIIARLRDPSPAVRTTAIGVCSRLERRPAALRDRLSDDEPKVAAAALAALLRDEPDCQRLDLLRQSLFRSEGRDGDACQVLVSVIASEHDPDVRAHAIELARDFVEAFLLTRGAYVSTVIDGLAEHGDDSDLRLFRRAIAAEGSTGRKSAISALARRGGLAVVPELLPLLDTRDDRYLTIEALGLAAEGTGDREVARTLADLDEHHKLGLAVPRALIRIGDASTRPRARELAERAPCGSKRTELLWELEGWDFQDIVDRLSRLGLVDSRKIEEARDKLSSFRDPYWRVLHTFEVSGVSFYEQGSVLDRLARYVDLSQGDFRPESVSVIENWATADEADLGYTVQFVHDERLYRGRTTEDPRRLNELVNRALEDAGTARRFWLLEQRVLYAEPAGVRGAIDELYLPIALTEEPLPPHRTIAPDRVLQGRQTTARGVLTIAMVSFAFLKVMIRAPRFGLLIGQHLLRDLFGSSSTAGSKNRPK